MNFSLLRLSLWIFVGLMLTHTLLPNSLESTLLATEVSAGAIYNVPLIVVALIATLTVIPSTKLKKEGLILGLLYLTGIIFSQLIALNSMGSSSDIFAFALYTLPLSGLILANQIVKTPKVGKMFVLGIILIVGSQGALLLLNQLVPFVNGLKIVQQGESFRQSFATYRYGSTAASANTSGCLLALSIPAAFRYLNHKRTRFFLLLFIGIAILGYQSRSGILIYLVAILSTYARLSIKQIAVISIAVIVAVSMVNVIRNSDEISSSNAYRLALATEAYKAFESAPPLAWIFGQGPNAAVEKNLASYYGVDRLSAAKKLLPSSESALIAMIVEIGVFGTGMLILLISRQAGSGLVMLAFFEFIVFDPSFSRPYESLLATILVSLAAIQNGVYFKSQAFESRLQRPFALGNIQAEQRSLTYE